MPSPRVASETTRAGPSVQRRLLRGRSPEAAWSEAISLPSAACDGSAVRPVAGVECDNLAAARSRPGPDRRDILIVRNGYQYRVVLDGEECNAGEGLFRTQQTQTMQRDPVEPGAEGAVIKYNQIRAAILSHGCPEILRFAEDPCGGAEHPSSRQFVGCRAALRPQRREPRHASDIKPTLRRETAPSLCHIGGKTPRLVVSPVGGRQFGGQLLSFG
jgi:hypothetical protein